MIFTSGTQALQNRTVNHDPIPFAFGATNSSVRGPSGGIGYVFVPRSEFDVLDNNVLVEFRKIKNKYGTVADSARWCLENGVWEPDSPLLGGLDVAHAHKVLTRLAQWKEN